MSLDFDSLSEDDQFLAHVGEGIWLMDDHRWALKVWETNRKQDSYALIHADYHWDACYDFYDSPEQEARLLSASSSDLAELVAAGEWIKLDSFIAPAIRRGLINTVHFYCFQDEDEALDEDLLKSCGAKQVFHSSVESLAAANIDGPLIFDLCLDLFNRSDQWEKGDLWSDEEISRFLEAVRPMVVRSDIVTIAMSFNYSGTHADTKHLARLVVLTLLAQRHDAQPCGQPDLER
ncbi:MAG TPA: UPF0489 family protein [Rhodocyclaceae bacterium]|nr:UPF0489 family protein [Rhodocyclaceae bacterium]